MNSTVTQACDMPKLAGIALEAGIEMSNWREIEGWLQGRNPATAGVVVASQDHCDEDALALIVSKMPRPA